jgi:hypothetical protein
MLLSLSCNKESDQRKFKAADNFGALAFQLAHAIQLALRQLADRSNSIAYSRPLQQASKQSLFPKIL